MRITQLDAVIVNVPYRQTEVSARVHRGGVTSVIVRLSTDEGIVGWGESCVGPNAESIRQAILAAEPFVVGQDPWQTEAIAEAYFKRGMWDRRLMTGNFAFAGIDQALWDICGKAAGVPLYRLLGGSRREQVNYFYYLKRGEPDEIAGQCKEGLQHGYTCFYLKVGIDAAAEERMLAAMRDALGPEPRIRIDANESWSPSEATHLLNRWHTAFRLDFVEAPVRSDPLSLLRDVRSRTTVPICANEGLEGVANVMRVLDAGVADVLCFSGYWVGTIHRFLTLCHVADLRGVAVCKHTHGELGIAAAAAQHVMLAAPRIVDGIQQTAQIMTGDIIDQELPIASGPNWGPIERPGLGVSVDEGKLAKAEEGFRRDGQFLPYKQTT